MEAMRKQEWENGISAVWKAARIRSRVHRGRTVTEGQKRGGQYKLCHRRAVLSGTVPSSVPLIVPLEKLAATRVRGVNGTDGTIIYKKDFL